MSFTAIPMIYVFTSVELLSIATVITMGIAWVIAVISSELGIVITGLRYELAILPYKVGRGFPLPILTGFYSVIKRLFLFPFCTFVPTEHH